MVIVGENEAAKRAVSPAICQSHTHEVPGYATHAEELPISVSTGRGTIASSMNSNSERKSSPTRQRTETRNSDSLDATLNDPQHRTEHWITFLDVPNAQSEEHSLTWKTKSRLCAKEWQHVRPNGHGPDETRAGHHRWQSSEKQRRRRQNKNEIAKKKKHAAGRGEPVRPTNERLAMEHCLLIRS